MRTPKHAAVAALVIGLALAAAARGGTRKVPSQFPTISAALEEAETGDTILVAPGHYVDSVFIGANKYGHKIDAITVRGDGKGAVTLEPAEPGPIFRVKAHDVVLENMTLRDATEGSKAGAVFVEWGYENARLRNLTAVRCYFGFYVYGTDCVVESCRAIGGAVGFTANSDARFVDCEALHNTSWGIGLNGHRVTVEDCVVRGVRGIQFAGDDSRVTGCEVYTSQTGVQIYSHGSGVVFEKNLVEGAAEYGVKVQGEGRVVRKNVVRGCGVGFEVSGVGHVLTGNVVRDCTDDGFAIDGDEHELKWNDARACLIDGFDVRDTASAVRLIGNVARDNHGEGIENSGAGTVLKGNHAKRNRVDLASDGTLASFKKNTYGSGGPDAVPETD